MKWTGLYLIGYVILIGGLLAALWKMGILASIGRAWTLIGIVIAVGIGIMLAVSSSGSKGNIRNRPEVSDAAGSTHGNRRATPTSSGFAIARGNISRKGCDPRRSHRCLTHHLWPIFN